jgi:subfamily B ATP-binding cassette protein MsbA
MSRRTENEKAMKSVSYWRILSFARPYWLRLAVGVIMGLIVGGTLFGGLMLLPDMATIVDQDTGQSVKNRQMAEEVILAVEQASPEMDREERIRMIAEIMNPADADPKLTRALPSITIMKWVP